MIQRATKIVATLGPASSAPDLLEAMIRAGVNVVRLNFSHGVAQDHIERARLVRRETRVQIVSMARVICAVRAPQQISEKGHVQISLSSRPGPSGGTGAPSTASAISAKSPASVKSL